MPPKKTVKKTKRKVAKKATKQTPKPTQLQQQSVVVNIDGPRKAPRKRKQGAVVPRGPIGSSLPQGVSGYAISNTPSRPFIVPSAVSLPPAGVPAGPNQPLSSIYVRPRIHSNPFFESGPVRDSGTFEDALARLSIPSRVDKTPMSGLTSPANVTPSTTKSALRRREATKDNVIGGQSADIMRLSEELLNAEQRARQRESRQSQQTVALVSSLGRRGAQTP